VIEVQRFWSAAFLFPTLLAYPAMAQQLGQGQDPEISFGRVIASVIFILTLGAAALWIVKLRGGQVQLFSKREDRRLKLLETSRLSPQSSLCLAVLDDKEYLIAITPGGATLLDVKPANSVKAGA
jgi:flagellar biogenesis protein FliO